MSYSDEELLAAAEKYVRGDVSYRRDVLGPLDAEYSFSQLMELVSSTLVFESDAIFYILYLVSNNLSKSIADLLSVADDMAVAVNEVGRRTKAVTRTSLLDDASNALLSAENILAEKGALTQHGLVRYTRAIDSFIDVSLKTNVRKRATSETQAYTIARPPQRAQEDLASGLASLEGLHETVMSRITLFVNAFDDFMSLDLPKKAVQSALSSVRVDIKSIKQDLDRYTVEESIAAARDIYLNLAAGQSVLGRLSSINDPSQKRIEGTSAISASVRHFSWATGSQPAYTFSNSGPYRLTPSEKEFEVYVDGGVIQYATLPVIAPAKIVGSQEGPFTLTEASSAFMEGSQVDYFVIPASPDNIFDVSIDGVMYRATLTPGSRTAVQVAAEINAATALIGGALLSTVATASDSPDGRIDIETFSIGGDASIAIGDREAVNLVLGFANGQEAEGTDENNKLRLMVDTFTEVVVDLGTGDQTATAVAATIQAASPSLLAGMEVIEALPADKSVIYIQTATYGAAGAIASKPSTYGEIRCSQLLGLTDGLEAKGLDTPSSEVVTELNTQLTGVTAVREYATIAEGPMLSAQNVGTTIGEISVSKSLLVEEDSFYVGKTLFIDTGANAGARRILSVTRGATLATIRVRDAFPELVGTWNWEIVEDVVTLYSDEDLSVASLMIGVGDANTELGATAGDVEVGTTTGLEVRDMGNIVRLEGYGVKVGDTVYVNHAGVYVPVIVESVEEDGYALNLDTELSLDLSSVGFYIYSPGSIAYASAISSVRYWKERFDDSVYGTRGVAPIAQAITPLLGNVGASQGWINEAASAINAYISYFRGDLDDSLRSFVVDESPRVTDILNALLERGLERSYDILLTGDFITFFGLGKDTASYAGNLLGTMRAVAQNDTPALTDDDDALDGTIEDGVDYDVDADTDFSDMDREGGIVDDVNVLDPDEESDFLKEV